MQTELYAVIGNPVAHSLSPLMMNAAFEALSVPARYFALQVDSIDEDMRILEAIGIRGLSVTIPHKEAVFRIAGDRVDESARRIGAVNTLRRTGDGWEGRNTDWVGAVRALEAAGPLSGKTALVIGAGGAARAVIFGLQARGATVLITNRGTRRGEALAVEFGCGFIPLESIRLTGSFHDIIVQCTPVGLAGSGTTQVVPDSFFKPGMIVLDTVYRPVETGFLSAARRAGCTAVSGIEMLLLQGAAQLEWWLGRPVPFEVTRKMRQSVMDFAGND